MHRSVRRLTVTVVTAALATAGLVVPALPAVAEGRRPTSSSPSTSRGRRTTRRSRSRTPRGLRSSSAACPCSTSATARSRPASRSRCPAPWRPTTCSWWPTAGHGGRHPRAGRPDEQRRLVQRRRRGRAKAPGDVVVDSIGQVGVDPVTEWGTGLTSTVDNTLRRDADVRGRPNPSDAFDPASSGWLRDRHLRRPRRPHLRLRRRRPEPATRSSTSSPASTTGPRRRVPRAARRAGADLSGLRGARRRGRCGSPTLGVVDEVITLGTADADGRYLADLAAEHPRERHHQPCSS